MFFYLAQGGSDLRIAGQFQNVPFLRRSVWSSTSQTSDAETEQFRQIFTRIREYFAEVATCFYYLPGLIGCCSSAHQPKGTSKEKVSKPIFQLTWSDRTFWASANLNGPEQVTHYPNQFMSSYGHAEAIHDPNRPDTNRLETATCARSKDTDRGRTLPKF